MGLSLRRKTTVMEERFCGVGLVVGEHRRRYYPSHEDGRPQIYSAHEA